MFDKRKFLILLSAFVVLGVVLTTPLSEFGRFGQSYVETPKQSEVLNIDEMNSFLNLWSELMQKDIGGYRSQQLSLSNQSAVDGFPPQLVRWLKRHGWSAERFFYDEQKIRGLVNIASLEQNIAANEKLLSEQSTGDGMKANLKEIVRLHKKQLKAMQANPQELALVKANLYQITQIMDGKAILQKQK